MFGQSQFVTKGTIVVIVLLFIGTAWADNTVSYDFSLHKSDIAFSYDRTKHADLSVLSFDNMEEVVVSAKSSTSLDVRNLGRFQFKPVFFPEQFATNVADHAELSSFDDRHGRIGFVELFRVRFGGSG